MLGVDRALVRDHVPRAIRALVGLAHHALRFNRRPAHARRLGIGVGGAGGVKVPVQRIIKRADDPVEVGDRGDLADFFGADDFGVQPHKAVLGPFGQQHIKPVLIISERDTPHMVQAAGHAGQLFQLLIKPDGIALKRGHIRVAIQRVKTTCRVPCGAGRQFRPFKQHNIRPPQFCQVIKHRCADDAASDNGDTGCGLHAGAPSWFCW